MKTAREMRDATFAYKRAADEQTCRLLTSWMGTSSGRCY